MKPSTLTLSKLNKTWIFDLDGTLVQHNGYKTGTDQFLPKAKEFLQSIPRNDVIIILTAREESAKESTISFLQENNIRYDYILFNIPMGERILLNDSKPSGLRMSYAIECKRNKGLDELIVNIDPNL